MPTGPQGQKRPRDSNACAVHVARIATGEIEEDPVQLPQPHKVPGATAGGRARAAKLTPEQRSEIARKAGRSQGKMK